MTWRAIRRTAIVLTATGLAAFVIAGVTGNLDPTPQDKARWAAEAKLREANDKARRLEAQHEAWRGHIKDDVLRHLGDIAVNSASLSLSDMIGRYGTIERERNLAAIVENEEQAHPEAWKSYHP